MAGFGESLGWANNPFYKAFDANRSALVSGFSGIGADPRNPAAGFSQGFANGMQLDQQRSDQQMEEQERQQQINVTAAFLREKGAEDLAAAVEGGMTSGADAFNQWYQQANAAPKAPIEVGGVLVDPVTFQPIFDSRQPEKPPAAPSGYQWTPEGTQAFIPGGPADPSTQAKTTEAQRRNQQLASVIQPELATVEQNWDALADGGNQTWGSNPVTAGMASPEYQQARNSLNVIAQSYLYSVSGAAATDAEVQKIVDSVTPKPFESPQSIAAKKARIQQMADAVIQAGGGAQQQAPGGQTSTGLQWSIEP